MVNFCSDNTFQVIPPRRLLFLCTVEIYLDCFFWMFAGGLLFGHALNKGAKPYKGGCLTFLPSVIHILAIKGIRPLNQ